jgi:hypothetical protein
MWKIIWALDLVAIFLLIIIKIWYPDVLGKEAENTVLAVNILLLLLHGFFGGLFKKTIDLFKKTIDWINDS